MYQAENENKIRIEAEEATKGLKYFCPCCGKEVILKQGDVVTWHFAHKSSKECDSWYSMSKWHEEWQKKFNKKYREVVIERDGEKHRADVKIDHSTIMSGFSPSLRLSWPYSAFSAIAWSCSTQ